MQATRNDFPDGVEKHKLSSGKAVSTFPFPQELPIIPIRAKIITNFLFIFSVKQNLMLRTYDISLTKIGKFSILCTTAHNAMQISPTVGSLHFSGSSSRIFQDIA